MDVKTLCLGALSYGEATGYDIKHFFECTFSHFFVAGYGSIYPALADLTEKGCVTYRRESQEGKPERKVYQLTETGRMAFLQDLEAAPPNHKVRSEFLVLMFFADLLSPEHLAAIIDERVRELDALLESIQESKREAMENESPEASIGPRFCGGYGEVVMKAARDYIVECRQGLLEKDPRSLPGN